MGMGLVELVNQEKLLCAKAVLGPDELKYQALLEHLNNSYVLFRVIKDYNNKQTRYIFQEINPAFALQMGISQETVIGRDIADTVVGDGRIGIEWTAVLAATAQDGISRTFEQHSVILQRWFRISVFSPVEGQLAVLLVDITLQKEKQQPVYRDVFTGLPSQRLLEDRLMLAIMQAKRTREQLAVAIFDVENVAALIDSYGYESGDELVLEIARRTVDCLRQSDTVARVGLATFIMILPGVKTRNFAVMVANRVLEECRQPFQLRDTIIIPSGTISLCFFPQDQANFAEAVSKEDVRMYLSKQRQFPQVCLTF